jgi:low affinity Fe/Cu permease
MAKKVMSEMLTTSSIVCVLAVALAVWAIVESAIMDCGPFTDSDCKVPATSGEIKGYSDQQDAKVVVAILTIFMVFWLSGVLGAVFGKCKSKRRSRR